jgi:hypothetical protein
MANLHPDSGGNVKLWARPDRPTESTSGMQYLRGNKGHIGVNGGGAQHTNR